MLCNNHYKRNRAHANAVIKYTCVLSMPSVQFSRSVMSNSLWPHELQHARPPCPSPTPRVHSDSHPSCQWCHPAISSSVISFFSCLQSFPESGSFSMSQFFTSGGQSIQHHSSKASILQCLAFFIVQLSMNKFKQTHNWSQTLKWICKWVQLVVIYRG